MDGTLTVEQTSTNTVPEEELSSDDDVFGRLRTFMHKSDDETADEPSQSGINNKTTTTSTDKLLVEEETEQMINKILKKDNRKKILIDSDSESEDSDKENSKMNISQNDRDNNKTSRGIMDDSDSDSSIDFKKTEMLSNKIILEGIESSAQKQRLIIESDESNDVPTTSVTMEENMKRNRETDSDSENRNIPKKKRIMIMSDDED